MALRKVLFVPDVHAPYHDKRAWSLLLKVGKWWKPNTLVCLGDLGDFYAVSSHSKDPSRANNLRAEIEGVRERRAELDALGADHKMFVSGNHEHRLERYLQDKAPELFGLVTVDDLLELSANDWEVTPYRQSTRLGKIRLTHDVGSAGRYSTQRALDTFQHSVVIGHHHAIQYQVSGDATGKYQVGSQFGWLGDISKVDYMHKVRIQRTWALGFGLGYHEQESGVVWLVPVPLVNYRACVEGKVFSA